MRKPPDKDGRPAGEPGAEQIAGEADRQGDHTAAHRHEAATPLGPVGHALLDGIVAEAVDLADIPPDKLASPTVGAWRRQHGVTGWCVEARVLFAHTLVEEAARRELLDRLDSICRFIVAGATIDQVTIRLADLLDLLYPDLLADFLETTAVAPKLGVAA